MALARRILRTAHERSLLPRVLGRGRRLAASSSTASSRGGPQRVLIVSGHPEPKSFTGSLAAAAVNALQHDHHVRHTDLYGIKWKPTADALDYPPVAAAGMRDDPSYLRIDREQSFAHDHDTVAADIAEQQEAVRWANVLILQYPMWWFGMPAIMKGWVDRVFTRGFAYLPGRKYDTGMLKGKLALVSVTTGTSADTYAPDGIDGSMLDVLWPVHNGLLRYCGFDVATPFVAYAPGRMTPDQRDAELRRYQQHVRGVMTLAAAVANGDDRTAHATVSPTNSPWQATHGACASTSSAPRLLFFHPRHDYGSNERLRHGVVARSGFQHNIESTPASAPPATSKLP